MTEKYKYRIVGNAWKKETKAGKIYLSVSMKEDVKQDQAIFMFPNDRKRDDKNDPDWVLNTKNEEEGENLPF